MKIMEENIGTIFILGHFKFYLENAESQLVLENGKLLRECGYRVVYFASSDRKDTSKYIVKTKYLIDNFDIYEVKFQKKINDFWSIPDIHKQLIEIIQNYNNPKALIFYGTPTIAWQIYKLQKWAKKSNVNLIANCADLSALSHGSAAQRIMKFIDMNWRYYLFKYKMDGIIAVSTYIANYYESGKKKKIVIIPPLRDIEHIDPPVEARGNLKLVYAGIPFPIDGRKVDESSYKDRLDILIELLLDIKEECKPFELHLFGLTKEAYLRVIPKHKELLDKHEDIFIFHGRVAHRDVLEAEKTADYSINIRVKNRMTMAGFSSKVVESVSCGLPVLLTDTSDYKMYIKEGVNGFFLSEGEQQISKEKLKIALNMDRSKVNLMKRECYNSKIFDYHRYKKIMQDFMQEVLERDRL